MARVAHVYAIGPIAKRIGESRELIELISSNPDNIDDGEMIRVHDGTEEGITPSPTAASKACRNSSPMSGPGREASVSSWPTSNASPKRSNASWPTSRKPDPPRPSPDHAGWLP